MKEKYTHEGKYFDPVFKDHNEWYFWDETWGYPHGPFPSEEIARQKLNEYCKEYLDFQNDEVTNEERT